jgi:phosphoribosylformylglycinamidine cyclo-ligase
MVLISITWEVKQRDVGDVVRTIAVNGTMTARWPKDKIISNEKIQAGDVIVGF